MKLIIALGGIVALVAVIFSSVGQRFYCQHFTYLYARSSICTESESLRAISNGDVSRFTALVSQGKLNPSFEVDGQSVLYSACASSSDIYIRALVSGFGDQILDQTVDGFYCEHIAVKNNALNVLMYILDLIPDVNRRDSFDFSPLFVAIEKGDNHLIRLLIENGANVNLRLPVIDRSKIYEDLTLLNRLSKRSLLESPLTPIQACSYGGNVECVRMLLLAGADPNAVNEHNLNSFLLSIYNSKWDVVDVLIDSPSVNISEVSQGGFDALLLSAWRGNFDLVKKLIVEKSMNPFVTISNYKNILHLAALGPVKDHIFLPKLMHFLGSIKYTKNGSQYIEGVPPISSDTSIETLLNIHPDSVAASLIEERDEHGMTPLLISCSEGFVQGVTSFLYAHANPNAFGRNGVTCAMLLSAQPKCVEKDPLIFQKLVAAGANLNAYNSVGNVAVFTAVQNGFEDVAIALLNAGANWRVSGTREGFRGKVTLVSLVTSKNMKKCLELLRILSDRDPIQVNAPSRDNSEKIFGSPPSSS